MEGRLLTWLSKLWHITVFYYFYIHFTLFFYSWSIISFIFQMRVTPNVPKRGFVILTVFQGQFHPQGIAKQPHTHTQTNTYIFSNTLVYLYKYLHSLWQSMIYTQHAHTFIISALVGNLGLFHSANSEPQAITRHTHVSTLNHAHIHTLIHILPN